VPTPPLQTPVTQVGLAKETTWGTAVAPTTADQFIPITNPKPEDVIDNILDNNYRSRISFDQGGQQGFRYSKYSFDSHVYPDVAGNWFMGLFGVDGWASGTTHPFTVLNSGLPASYTLQDFYGISGTNTRSYTGLYFESLAISGTDKGPLKATVSLSGGKAGVLVAKPSATYTTALPFLTWQGVLTLNSVANAKMISWDILFKRNVAGILAMGSQDPSAGYSAEFTVTGKMAFASTDDTEYLLYNTTAQAQFPNSLLFTSGSNTMTIVMTKCQFETPTTFDRSTPYVKTMVTFRGIDNATDAGAAKVTIVGGKSGAAY
jgi:hypothetical protein